MLKREKVKGVPLGIQRVIHRSEHDFVEFMNDANTGLHDDTL